MTDIICRDAFGDPLEFLTQWDVNQKVVIEGIELSPCPTIRFSNKHSKVSLVVRPTIVDDKLQVDIPNILLQQSYPIIVNIFYEYDDSAKTRHIFLIPVIPSKCPEDYNYIHNIDYVSWVEIEEQAKALIAELEQSKDPIIVGVSEPANADILWFDTNYQVTDSQ